MNLFAVCIVVVLNFVLRFDSTASCDIGMVGTCQLNVKVFFDFDEGKWGATSQLLDTVCENYSQFQGKMTVEFHLIGRVQEDSSSGIMCESSEECDDELAEACAETLADDPVKFLCCNDDFQTCLVNSGTSWQEVMDCVNAGYDGDAGQRLLDSRNLMYSKDLDEGPLPAMVFGDNSYDECIDNMAYDDFVGTTCQMFAADCAPKPPC